MRHIQQQNKNVQCGKEKKKSITHREANKLTSKAMNGIYLKIFETDFKFRRGAVERDGRSGGLQGLPARSDDFHFQRQLQLIRCQDLKINREKINLDKEWRAPITKLRGWTKEKSARCEERKWRESGSPPFCSRAGLSLSYAVRPRPSHKVGLCTSRVWA